MSDQPQVIRVARETPDLHGVGSQIFTILKKAAKLSQDQETREETESNAGVSEGVKGHLIDKDVASELRDFNATHAICIDAKKASSVGLGHRDREIHKTLDPLCRFSWQDVLDADAEDYWEGGEGYIEVVFGDDEDPQLVTGLHHLEGRRVNVEVEEENSSELYHYIVEGETGGAEQIVMARWGDLIELKKRFPSESDITPDEDPGFQNANDVPARSAASGTISGKIRNSEIIHIRQSTNRSRYYGYPDYMSAVPSIELVQCMTQHEFDFYFNRGVPEFLLFLIGNNIGSCMKKLEDMIKANQGLGNSHKTGLVHLPGTPEDYHVQIEKLAMDDAANSGFSEKSDTLDMRICTAHGMPPQLANIALPGKIGAANEGPNAMLTFQMRKLGQAQKNWSNILACTLGSKGIKFAQPDGNPKSLTADQFLAKGAKPMDENDMPQFVTPGNGFNTILDGMTLGERDTLASMKEPLAGSDRNPSDGKLKGARDRKAGDKKKTRGPGTGR